MRSLAKAAAACAPMFLAIGLAANANGPAMGKYPCEADPAYRKLDFWLGRWDAFDSQDTTAKVGTNVIEKSENGCAITETWHEADGSGEALGLFYYQPADRQWKYILVSASGGLKERVLTQEVGNGGISFQGEVRGPKAPGSHLDRFTIFPLPNGRARETVEISRDGGKTWEMTFDCEYRKQN